MDLYCSHRSVDHGSGATRTRGYQQAVQPGRIVFYLWPWRAEGIHFCFSFTPRYAIRAKAAPATLSDYYNPDMEAVLDPQQFEVN
jgi:hypothetical protein